MQTIWCVPVHEHRTGDCPVVIFAFSGLRWDVGDIQSMPAIEQLKSKGVWGKRKIDVFQSESLPAFVSMVTGQYPDKHGMLSNKMRDQETGEKFNVRNTSSKWWNGFEPIWITNQKKHNGTGRSALCYWPGHDVMFDGQKAKYVCHNTTANYADPFKEFTLEHQITKAVMPFGERVSQVEKWLKMNVTDRPSFIGVYFEEPLNTMLNHGVHSNETKRMLKKIDSIVSDTLNRLKNDELYEDLTFIVTGESGVTEIDLGAHREFFLDDKLNKEQQSQLEVIDDGPIMTLYTHDKESLLSLWEDEKGMKVYTNETIPKSFHFSHKNRTAPLIIVAEEHWRVYKSRVVDDMKCLMGYDGKFPSSHALFVAKGPVLKKNLALNALGNVDVYGILCKALNITPPVPHSGNEAIISKVIVERQQWLERVVTKIVKTISAKPRNLIIAIIVAAMLVFVAVFLVITAIYKVIGCCVCPSTPMLVKVSSRKLLRKRKDNKEKGGKHHLLADDEMSDSELSSNDEFYFDSVERKK